MGFYYHNNNIVTALDQSGVHIRNTNARNMSDAMKHYIDTQLSLIRVDLDMQLHNIRADFDTRLRELLTTTTIQRRINAKTVSNA